MVNYHAKENDRLQKECGKLHTELDKERKDAQGKSDVYKKKTEQFQLQWRRREEAEARATDEITKARIEKEQFEAKCQEKVQNIKQALEAQINTLREQVNYHAKENDRLKKEYGKLHTELDKERKDAQGKSDVYKKKTEQFQLQWRRREEAEARATTLTEQLNAQCELNKQLNSTIDSMMRKSKGIDPQIPPNNMASQIKQLTTDNDKLNQENARVLAALEKHGRGDYSEAKQFQMQWKEKEETKKWLKEVITGQLEAQRQLHQQLHGMNNILMKKKGSSVSSHRFQNLPKQVSPHNPPMSTPLNTLSNQYHTSSTVSNSDPSRLAHKNAGIMVQPPPTSSQMADQRYRQQQYFYKPPQQQQEHFIGQGRGLPHNQPVKPLHEGTHLSNYQGQGKYFLPPANIYLPSRFSVESEYNVAGTNAAPMQRQFSYDVSNYARDVLQGPATLDGSITKSRSAAGYTNHPPPDRSEDYNYRRNSVPASLDSSITKSRSAAGYTNYPPSDQCPLTVPKRPEKSTQYASEGINEEICYQVDKQCRHQEYKIFDSNPPPLDPYLICPKCKLQFREGQLLEYRHHIDNCNQ